MEEDDKENEETGGGSQSVTWSIGGVRVGGRGYEGWLGRGRGTHLSPKLISAGSNFAAPEVGQDSSQTSPIGNL